MSIYQTYAIIDSHSLIEVTMKKLINFKSLGEKIQSYADEHCEGNFSLAVRVLIKKGLDNVDDK